MNSCDYLFTAGTYVPEITEGSDGSEGELHIKCENPEDSITITVFEAGSTEHLPSETICTTHEGPQTLGPVTYHNTTTEGVMAVTVTMEIENQIVSTREGPLCGEAEDTEGDYHGSFWAKGTDGSGNYVDTTVTAGE